ncbi:branched-chain amino acid ABC transporter permease [Mesorhizobium sp. CO1-1-8]|uniref:branched-chain amino acid ABC transporter permease n=1 Tax=Mesorhizobium sp. CO1-1-8 TaxID=2876631 RepID=UPI001CD083BB|nr:branched-chain amino acid ABC transporter permease [Mesorhizobium sp. CO1-1-8]MBZ9772572.1 branched-chain amino acid ABC transporter permease [Mesorhizobium sp. CO1-1-8]
MVTVKLIFDIVAFASVMVLVVSGLAIVASLMGIFNFAHGEFVLLGAYTVYLFGTLGLPIWAGMIAAPFVVAVVGVAVEMAVVRRLYATPIIAMLATFAVGLIIRETVRILIGGQYHEIKEPLDGFFEIAGVNFSMWRTLIIVATITLMVSAYTFLKYSRYGLQIRGAMENPSLARVSGLSTSRLYSATFASGAALAGLAGALIVPLFSLSADMGVRFLVQAFLSVMLGGVGTFEGPMAGAAMVGSMVPGFQWLREIPVVVDHVTPVLAEVMVFVVALIIVKFRPQGLIARGRR